MKHIIIAAALALAPVGAWAQYGCEIKVENGNAHWTVCRAHDRFAVCAYDEGKVTYDYRLANDAGPFGCENFEATFDWASHVFTLKGIAGKLAGITIQPESRSVGSVRGDIPATPPSSGFATILSGSDTVASGLYSFAIGSGARCTEDYAFCLGGGSNAAVRHEDGTWTIDWPAVERIASVVLTDDDRRRFIGPLPQVIAQLLLAARGKIRER